MVERWKGPGFVSLLISRQHLSAARCLFQVLTGSSSVKPNICEEISPGRYQRLDLFMLEAISRLSEFIRKFSWWWIRILLRNTSKPLIRFLKESTVWSRNLSSFKNLLTVAGGLDRLLEDVLVLRDSYLRVFPRELEIYQLPGECKWVSNLLSDESRERDFNRL